MRAFVTGGSGFIGGTLVRRLRERGDAVVALARSEAASRAVAAAGALPVRGDLDDPGAMREGMAGADVVFHAAATVRLWGSREAMRRVNVLGTEHVLAAARAAGVPRLVHVSTEAVLFDGSPLRRVDERAPLPARPVGPYAWSKGLAERRVLAACSPALATIVVRPRMVWGPGDTSVLQPFAAAVRSGRFRWIDGGNYLTSTCHVRNACEGLLLAAERGQAGEIYFVTDGEPVELRAFISALLRTQGLDAGEGSIPRWAARALAPLAETAWRALRLPDEPPLTRAALAVVGQEVTVVDAKARRELGYTGAMSREAGLAELSAAAAGTAGPDTSPA